MQKSESLKGKINISLCIYVDYNLDFASVQ